jgi:hypothetical protein
MHTHNKRHKIWNSLYQSQNFLTSLIPVTFIGNKAESNWKQLCRVLKEVSRLPWVWLSVSGATGDIAVFILQEWWQFTLKFKCLQTWFSVGSCTPPTDMKFYYHWLVYRATSPCLQPYITPVLTRWVTSILGIWRVSKRCDLIFLCLHSFIYSMLIVHSYHNTNQNYYTDTVKLFLLELFKMSAISIHIWSEIPMHGSSVCHQYSGKFCTWSTCACSKFNCNSSIMSLCFGT